MCRDHPASAQKPECHSTQNTLVSGSLGRIAKNGVGLSRPTPSWEGRLVRDKLVYVSARMVNQELTRLSFRYRCRDRLRLWACQTANGFAFASASVSPRPPRPRHGTSARSGWPVSVYRSCRPSRRHSARRIPPLSVSPLRSVYDPDRVALPGPIDARNRKGPSGDGRAVIPNVSDIHPGPSRVGC